MVSAGMADVSGMAPADASVNGSVYGTDLEVDDGFRACLVEIVEDCLRQKPSDVPQEVYFSESLEPVLRDLAEDCIACRPVDASAFVQTWVGLKEKELGSAQGPIRDLAAWRDRARERALKARGKGADAAGFEGKGADAAGASGPEQELSAARREIESLRQQLEARGQELFEALREKELLEKRLEAQEQAFAAAMREKALPQEPAQESRPPDAEGQEEEELAAVIRERDLLREELEELRMAQLRRSGARDLEGLEEPRDARKQELAAAVRERALQRLAGEQAEGSQEPDPRAREELAAALREKGLLERRLEARERELAASVKEEAAAAEERAAGLRRETAAAEERAASLRRELGDMRGEADRLRHENEELKEQLLSAGPGAGSTGEDPALDVAGAMGLVLRALGHLGVASAQAAFGHFCPSQGDSSSVPTASLLEGVCGLDAMPRERAELLVASLDPDGSGFVEYSRFQAAVAGFLAVAPASFQRKLSDEEVCAILRRVYIGVVAGMMRVQDVFQEWGKGRGSALSLKEFVAGVLSLGVGVTRSEAVQVFAGMVTSQLDAKERSPDVLPEARLSLETFERQVQVAARNELREWALAAFAVIRDSIDRRAVELAARRHCSGDDMTMPQLNFAEFSALVRDGDENVSPADLGRLWCVLEKLDDAEEPTVELQEIEKWMAGTEEEDDEMPVSEVDSEEEDMADQQAHEEELPPLPDKWEKAWDSNNRHFYYYNNETWERTWDRPTGGA